MAALILTLALGGAAQAAALASSVTGDYTYQFFTNTTTIHLDAHAGDPATGSFSYVSGFASFSGPVTCVTVIGSDAWVAGPITAVTKGDTFGYDGWAERVHDGGTPGAQGDTAITFIDTFDAMVKYCQSAKTKSDRSMVPLTAGNLVVHAAR